jgi:hypothetical protein
LLIFLETFRYMQKIDTSFLGILLLTNLFQIYRKPIVARI